MGSFCAQYHSDLKTADLEVPADLVEFFGASNQDLKQNTQQAMSSPLLPIPKPVIFRKQPTPPSPDPIETTVVRRNPTRHKNFKGTYCA